MEKDEGLELAVFAEEEEEEVELLFHGDILEVRGET